MKVSSQQQVVPLLFAGGALALGLVAASLGQDHRPPEAAGSPAVTFTRDLAPIVFRSCAPCHHPGEAGPFSLITYGDVKSHARQIAEVTRKRRMPPWLPAADGLPLEDDAHLTESQIAKFQQWVDQGTPEGDPQALPAAPKFTPGWQLGPPDLVLQAAA